MNSKNMRFTDTPFCLDDIPRGVSSFTDGVLKAENASVHNCMKALVGTFGSPAITALGAFDPWLCVTAFRQLCLFVGKIIK